MRERGKGKMRWKAHVRRGTEGEREGKG
jgi:hypothetical protein